MNTPEFMEDALVELERMYIEYEKCSVCHSWNWFLYREEVFIDPALIPTHDPSEAKWRFIRETRETWYFQLLDAHRYPATTAQYTYTPTQANPGALTPKTMGVPTDFIPELINQGTGFDQEPDDDGKWCKCR